MSFKNMKYILSLFTVFILMVATAQVPSYVPTDSLIGYWPFNGNANDESGNGHDGIINGPSLAIDENGIADQAYNFDGNDKITIPHHSDFNVLSLSIMITYQDFDNPVATPNGNSLLFSKREASGWGASFEFNQGGANWDFAASNSINGNITYGFGAPQTYGVWRTVVYTHDADSINVYFDGVLIDNIASPGFYNSNGLDITVGMRGNGWHQFIGSIDDIAIWNRVLSEQEVQQLYSGSACTYYDTVTTQTTVYDTIITQIFDTTTFNDTITYYDTTVVFDTVNIYVVDTSYISISVTDTLFIDITVTGMNSMDNTITVYPNPANDVVIIDNGNYSSMSNYSLVIVNSLSQQVFTSQINTQQFQIPVSTLGAEGTYFIQIFDENNNLVVTKYLVLN